MDSTFKQDENASGSSVQSQEKLSPTKRFLGRIRTWSKSSENEESKSSSSPSPKKPKPPIKPKPSHLKVNTQKATEELPYRARAVSTPHGMIPPKSTRVQRAQSFDNPRLYAVKSSPMPQRVLVEYERNEVLRGNSRIQYHRSSIQENMPQRRFIISVLDEKD